MGNKIDEINNRITAINTVIHKMIGVHNSCANEERTEDVKKIIMDIVKSEMKFLTKKARKEYRNIEKEAAAMRVTTRNFDKKFFINDPPWGQRSDGR